MSIAQYVLPRIASLTDKQRSLGRKCPNNMTREQATAVGLESRQPRVHALAKRIRWIPDSSPSPPQVMQALQVTWATVAEKAGVATTIEEMIVVRELHENGDAHFHSPVKMSRSSKYWYTWAAEMRQQGFWGHFVFGSPPRTALSSVTRPAQVPIVRCPGAVRDDREQAEAGVRDGSASPVLRRAPGDLEGDDAGAPRARLRGSSAGSGHCTERAGAHVSIMITEPRRAVG